MKKLVRYSCLWLPCLQYPWDSDTPLALESSIYHSQPLADWKWSCDFYNNFFTFFSRLLVNNIRPIWINKMVTGFMSSQLLTICFQLTAYKAENSEHSDKMKYIKQKYIKKNTYWRSKYTLEYTHTTTHPCTGWKSEMAHPRMKKFTPKIAENSDLTR